MGREARKGQVEVGCGGYKAVCETALLLDANVPT